MKFKSDIELQSGLRDGDNDIGTAGQILSSTGSKTNWIDQDSIVASEAKLVVIECKNTSGVTISKGTPVYQTGTVGATDVIEIDVADASDEDKMAAIGLLQTDLANNAFGKVVITGELLNIITSPIDGVTPVTGDTIYVKSGGGLTLTKPTGVNFIQNIGLVGKVSGGNSGSITVSSIMRSNDVPTPLYIDHTNQRLGIGTASPQEKLDISAGNIRLDDNQRISWSSSDSNIGRVRITGNEPGNFIAIATNNSDRVRINDTGVGIGTTSPQYNLDIQSESPAIRIKDISDNNSFLVGADNGGAYLGTFTFDALRFLTDSSEKMRIKQNGNVGIGTNNPSDKLEVYGGNLIVNDGTSKSRLRPSDLYMQQAGVIKAWLRADGNSYLNGGNLGIGTTSPAYILDVVSAGTATARLKSAGTGAISLRYENGSGFKSAAVVDNNGLYRLDATNISLNPTNNVGIGTTSPSQKLDVNGAVLAGDYRGSNQVYLTSPDNWIFRSTTGNERMRITSAGNVGIGTTNPSNKLTIGQAVDGNGLKILGYDDESGSSVSLSVDSAGHARLSQTTDGSSGYLFLQAENYLQLIAGSFIYTTSTFRLYDNTQLEFGNSGDYKIYHSTSADTLYIHTNDNKGITVGNTGGVQFNTYGAGTLVTDASGNITVSSGGGAGGPYLPLAGGTMTGTAGVLMPDNFKLNLGTSSDLQIYHDGSNSFMVDAGAGDMLHYYSNDWKVIKYGTGELSIWATTDAGVKLYYDNVKKFETTSTGVTVAGNISFGDSHFIGDDADDNLLIQGSASENVIIRSEDGLYFRTGGNNTRLSINSSGNVGIGTTSPSKKLDVNGQTQFYEYTGAHLTNQATSNFNFNTLANNAASTNGGSVGAYIKLTGTPPGATGRWSAFRARAYGENAKGNTDDMINFFAEYRNYTSTNAVTLSHHAGLKVNSLGVGGLATVTNNYGVYLNPGTAATNNYGVYQLGTGVKNFFQGNVGIGTTSPNRKLSVYQSSSSLVADFRSASGNNSHISLSNNASTADQVRIGSASSSLVLSTNYTERMRITTQVT